MSQEHVEKLRQLLVSNGFVEGESYDGGHFIVRASEEFNQVEFVVRVELALEELPDELKPFEESAHDVERAMDKGNSTKSTWNGANFELALRNYASYKLQRDPEARALEATIPSLDSKEKLEAYQAERQRIWERVCSDPKILAWEQKLENYYL